MNRNDGGTRAEARLSFGEILCKFHDIPKTILLITREESASIRALSKIAAFFIAKYSAQIFVEKRDIAASVNLLLDQLACRYFKGSIGSNTQSLRADTHVDSNLRFRVTELSDEDPGNYIDLAVAIGGDKTVLWASHIFSNTMPPLLGLGSLGYMSQFALHEAIEKLDCVANHSFWVSLRTRIDIILIHADDYCRDDDHLPTNECAGGHWSMNSPLDGRRVCSDLNSRIKLRSVALNECVVDRSWNHNLATLDVYCNGSFMTTVQADGMIVSTTSGSTAYSMSAGGSVVHPKVPCLLFTPICPHTLSFRPVVLPESVTIYVHVPLDCRASVGVSADGRRLGTLDRGMGVFISSSPFPLPLIVRQDPPKGHVAYEVCRHDDTCDVPPRGDVCHHSWGAWCQHCGSEDYWLRCVKRGLPFTGRSCPNVCDCHAPTPRQKGNRGGASLSSAKLPSSTDSCRWASPNFCPVGEWIEYVDDSIMLPWENSETDGNAAVGLDPPDATAAVHKTDVGALSSSTVGWAWQLQPENELIQKVVDCASSGCLIFKGEHEGSERVPWDHTGTTHTHVPWHGRRYSSQDLSKLLDKQISIICDSSHLPESSLIRLRVKRQQPSDLVHCVNDKRVNSRE